MLALLAAALAAVSAAADEACANFACPPGEVAVSVAQRCIEEDATPRRGLAGGLAAATTVFGATRRLVQTALAAALATNARRLGTTECYACECVPLAPLPTPAPTTAAAAAPTCERAAGCTADIADLVAARGCYPRAACDADYAATFCCDLPCLPQSTDGDCSGDMATLNGHGVIVNVERFDLFDPVDNTPIDGKRPYYGASSYIRLLPLVAREIGEPVSASPEDGAHFGYWGQWIGPQSRVNYYAEYDEYMRASGSIEGGLFSSGKLGATTYPKYLLGASAHGYDPRSDTSRGWGFFEKAIDCKYVERGVAAAAALRDCCAACHDCARYYYY